MGEPRIEYTVRQLLEQINTKLDKVCDDLAEHTHDYVTTRYMWASIVTVASLGVALLAFFF